MSAANTPAFPQRYILPKNLDHAVKQLNDAELDELFKAAFDEAKRRGRLPGTVATDSTPSSRRPADLLTNRSPARDKSKRRKVDVAEVSLTRGQVNAVLSAFKAGITPSRIARQFGLSQSNVRKALASGESKR
jgi:DNA invertase Pin-like site-specific DNA recombinase